MKLHGEVNRGFSLVELMSAAAIGSVVAAAVLASFTFLSVSFKSASNYTKIHNNARKALDWMIRDIAAADSAVGSLTSNNLSLRLPATVNSSGTATAFRTVTFSYADNRLLRTETVNGSSVERVLATDMASISFLLYDQAGNPTSLTNSARSVAVNLMLQRTSAGQTQTESVISARQNFRNRK